MTTRERDLYLAHMDNTVALFGQLLRSIGDPTAAEWEDKQREQVRLGLAEEMIEEAFDGEEQL